MFVLTRMLVPYRSSDGPVGAPLEGAHVTERAAVDAAHVRVEGPGEPHALHPVQRRAARLFAILNRHSRAACYRTYVRNARRGRAGDPAADAAAAERAEARPLLLPARRRRLDARRHRSRADGDALGGDPRPDRRAGRPDLHHPHASRPRRRRRGCVARHGGAGHPGARRLRTVRARLGIPRLAGADRRVVRAERRRRRARAGDDRVRPRVRRLRPLRLESDARRSGRRDRRLARARRRRGTRTGTSPSTATACSSRATRSSRRSRRRSGSIRRAGPIRSTTTSGR